MLSTNTETPVVSQTSVIPDLLQALQIIPQLHVQLIWNNLRKLRKKLNDSFIKIFNPNNKQYINPTLSFICHLQFAILLNPSHYLQVLNTSYSDWYELLFLHELLFLSSPFVCSKFIFIYIHFLASSLSLFYRSPKPNEGLEEPAAMKSHQYMNPLYMVLILSFTWESTFSLSKKNGSLTLVLHNCFIIIFCTCSDNLCLNRSFSLWVMWKQSWQLLRQSFPMCLANNSFNAF